MKNLANYISISRIIMSIVLVATNTFSYAFYILYFYCGISDILDGFVARKTKNITKIGSILDSIADITFVIVSIIKILPLLNLHNSIIIWAIIIAFIRIFNVICAYIYYKKLIFPHTMANKITGVVLFIAPLILIKYDFLLFEIVICSLATFAAIQEGHYIRNKKIQE